MAVKCEICGREFKDTQGLSGHMQFKHPDEQEGNTKSMMNRPLDIAISRLKVPMIPEEFNGAAQIFWAGFNRGVEYGADTVLSGIRAAQELSSIGVQQAVPLIKMAQEMRQAEGQAAQILAAELGQATQQGNREVIAAIHGLAESQQTSSGPDPMAAMMAETMKPVFGHLMQTMLKMTGMGAAAGSPAGGNPASGGQPQPESVPAQSESWSPPNIKKRSRNEFEEQEDV